MEFKVLFHPVEFSQSALGKALEVLNAVNVDAGAFLGEFILAVIDPEMLVIPHIHQSVISSPLVRVDDRGRINLPSNDGLQRCFLTVGDKFSIHPAVAFEDAKYRLLDSSSSPF